MNISWKKEKKKSYEKERTKKVNNSQFSLAPDHQSFNTFGEGKIDIFIEIIATDDIMIQWCCWHSGKS